MFSIFMSFVTVQGITGATLDSVAVGTAKFALSSYIPILGGYLSDGFDLVLASCVLIKNSIGLSVLIILICLILVPLLEIIIFMLGLKAVAAIIEPVTDNRMSELVAKMSDNLMPLILAILGISFMFFIMIMLIIYTCNFGVIK